MADVTGSGPLLGEDRPHPACDECGRPLDPDVAHVQHGWGCDGDGCDADCDCPEVCASCCVEAHPRRGDMTPLTVGSLFSGIGGLDLGLERAGMQVVWQSEVDPYCCQVLAKHWPHVPNLGDVTTIDWTEVPRVDVICGGYPCQPFSFSGVRRGEADPRHLWSHMRDAIRVLRPRYALLENVPGHLSLGLDRVLADLAGLGFDAEWSLVSACSMGAPHMRERVFVLAHTPGSDVPDPLSHHHQRQADRHEPGGGRGGTRRPAWLPEPAVDRVAVGIPSRLVRDPLHALGNAVVPQVAEHIGRLLIAALACRPCPCTLDEERCCYCGKFGEEHTT